MSTESVHSCWYELATGWPLHSPSKAQESLLSQIGLPFADNDPYIVQLEKLQVQLRGTTELEENQVILGDGWR